MDLTTLEEEATRKQQQVLELKVEVRPILSIPEGMSLYPPCKRTVRWLENPPFWMVFTRKDGDFHGRTVSFQGG